MEELRTDAVTPGGSPTASRSAGHALLFLLFLGLYALFRLASAFTRLPEHTSAATLLLVMAVSASLAIGLPIAVIAGWVRTILGLRVGGLASAAPAAVGLLVWWGAWMVQPPRGNTLAPLAEVAQDVGKILAAAGLGISLARGIRDVNLLLPAGLFAAFADFVVVRFGTVKHALAPGNAKGQALVQALSARVPALHPSIPALTIGPADFLFLGVFLACACRFDMGLARNAWVLTAVLAVSLVLVPLLGPVPALAPMSVAFIATNRRSFNLTREEAVSTGVVLAVIGALFLGYFLFLYPERR